MRTLTLTAAALTASGLALAACTPVPAQPASITVYSGRTEPLVGPLIERFGQETGIRVEVRYADTAELAALLLEERENSPADVYFAQDAGALGAVSEAGLLVQLPSELLDRVPAAFRSPQGEWVGTSGRARVAVYDSRDVDAAELPQTIDGFTDPVWRGRIGWAPTNGSFQAFVTGYRQLRGDDAARAWLEGIMDNEPRTYEGNTPIVQAVADGEIDIGFVNHYYLLRAIAEQGEQFPVRQHFFSGGDPGGLVNVAGAAILASSDQQEAARRFVAYLLEEEQQRYIASETFEYPLVPGVEAPEGTPPLDQLQTPDLDLSDLADLQGTLRLLQEVGVLP